MPYHRPARRRSITWAALKLLNEQQAASAALDSLEIAALVAIALYSPSLILRLGIFLWLQFRQFLSGKLVVRDIGSIQLHRPDLLPPNNCSNIHISIKGSPVQLRFPLSQFMSAKEWSKLFE